jgi:O-antigen/teichoic acid export membrane protein
LAIAAAFGDRLLVWIFGPSFGAFGSLIIPVGVGQLLIAGTIGLALLLKAQARGKALLAARAVGSMSGLILVFALAVTYGITGAAWGLAVGSGLASLALVAYSIGGWVRARTMTEAGTAQEARTP